MRQVVSWFAQEITFARADTSCLSAVTVPRRRGCLYVWMWGMASTIFLVMEILDVTNHGESVMCGTLTRLGWGNSKVLLCHHDLEKLLRFCACYALWQSTISNIIDVQHVAYFSQLIILLWAYLIPDYTDSGNNIIYLHRYVYISILRIPFFRGVVADLLPYTLLYTLDVLNCFQFGG